MSLPPDTPRSRRAVIARAAVVTTLALSGCGRLDGSGPDTDTPSRTDADVTPAPLRHRWRTTLPAPIPVRFGEVVSAAVAPLPDGLAVASAGDSSVVALDDTSGDERWRGDVGGALGDVSPHDGDLYTRGGNGTVVRFGPDGTERWRAAPDPRTGVEEPIQVGRPLFVASDEERVYLATGPGDDEVGPRSQLLYALDAGGGSLAWASRVGGGSYHARRSSVGEGQVIVGSPVNGLAAHAVADGRRRWHTGRGPEPLVVAEPAPGRFAAHGRLLGADGRVFVRTGDGELAALDARTGEQVWSRDAYPSANAGTVVDGTLVFVEAYGDSAELRIRGLGVADGGDRFSLDLGVTVAGAPVTADRTFYVPTLAHTGEPTTSVRLDAVDVVDGARRWRTRTLDGLGYDPVASLAVGGDHVAVSVSDNDTRGFADTRIAAVSKGDGTVQRRLAVSDHAAVAGTDEGIYFAGEFSGRVGRLETQA